MVIKPVSCRKAGFDLDKKPVWIVMTDDGQDLSWTEGDKFVLVGTSEKVNGKYKHYRVKNYSTKLLTVVKYAIKKFGDELCKSSISTN